MEGNLRFKIDLASLIVGRKFTAFALFYFVFEGNFQVQAPPRGGGWAYIWRGDLTEGFGVTILGGLYLEGLIHRGAYFRNFTGSIIHHKVTSKWAQANGEVEKQNQLLLKRLQIAQAENKPWRAELRKYLTASRSIPPNMTERSPAELLF